MSTQICGTHCLPNTSIKTRRVSLECAADLASSCAVLWWCPQWSDCSCFSWLVYVVWNEGNDARSFIFMSSLTHFLNPGNFPRKVLLVMSLLVVSSEVTNVFTLPSYGSCHLQLTVDLTKVLDLPSNCLSSVCVCVIFSLNLLWAAFILHILLFSYSWKTVSLSWLTSSWFWLVVISFLFYFLAGTCVIF